jgi:hypothetical protein
MIIVICYVIEQEIEMRSVIQGKLLNRAIDDAIVRTAPPAIPDSKARITLVGRPRRRLWREGEPVHVVKPVRAACIEKVKRKE